MIKLDDHQISILGRPNFACAQFAKTLIAAGIYEDKMSKAVYEQAVFIHWASDLLEKWGDDWRDKGDEIIQNCLQTIRKQQADDAAGIPRQG